MKYLLILLFLPLFILSCSQGNDKNQNGSTTIDSTKIVTQEVFEKGNVISDLPCKNNNNHSFSLYLPKDYNTLNKYPVIIALDPQGKGAEPVNKYKELAEKFDLILIGSNTSKNGLSWDESEKIVNTLLSDIKNRLSINTSRIYLLGFSGGARIANAITQKNGEIEAAICCGGVSPSVTNYTPRTNYALVSIIGNADFNFVETYKYDKLEAIKVRHILLPFDGKHEWPPTETMDNAFWYLELNEMRKTPGYRDSTLIAEKIKQETEIFNKLISENKTVEAYEKCKKAITFYNGLNDLKLFYEKYSSFKQNKTIDEYLKREEAIWKFEDKEKQKYLMAMQNYDINWWKKNVQELNTKIKSEKDPLIADINKRILAYLSVVAYSQTSGLIKQKNIAVAEYFGNIYLLVDPENDEAHYLNACINALKRNKAEAIESLKKAVKYGFEDKTRMETDSCFKEIKNEKAFIDALSSIPSGS